MKQSLSTEEQARRAPPPPESLVGALQDRVHVESGKLIASKPIVVATKESNLSKSSNS